jgi:hypothetical protein
MKTMKSNLRAAGFSLAAAVAFAGTIVNFDASAVDAAGVMDNAPVIVNDHLVTHAKGTATSRFYHRFTNTTNVTADVIRFTVNEGPGNKAQTVTETGTFSPGVGIDREDTFASSSTKIQPSCTVTYVHFTDGTSWTAPRSK